MQTILLRNAGIHELAHIKEKEHDKVFYQTMLSHEPDYHQLELDARLFMMYV